MGLDLERGILVVDDEEGFREIVVCNLIGVGIPVSTCQSEEEAVKQIKETRKLGKEIDLLTDLDGVNGIAVARYFRDIFPPKLHPDLRAFLMTASREADIPKGLFDGRFDKPFDPKIMVKTIQELRGYFF